MTFDSIPKKFYLTRSKAQKKMNPYVLTFNINYLYGKNSNSSAIFTPSHIMIHVQENNALYAHAIKFIFKIFANP